MKVSFLRTVRVARDHDTDEFFLAYVYDLPDREDAVFIRKGLAYEPSEYDMVADVLLRLSWPSSRRWRTPTEVVKALRSVHGIYMTEKEASRILEDLAYILPVKKSADGYSIVDAADTHVCIDEVLS